jgi:DNA-binding Xre family transcriptional regulator
MARLVRAIYFSNSKTHAKARRRGIALSPRPPRLRVRKLDRPDKPRDDGICYDSRMTDDARDRAALRASRTRTKASDDDALPVVFYRRIRAGENPVRVWRTHRKLGLNVLAERASVARAYLSEIETGKKPGSATALQRIAEALGVEMDELVSQKRNGRV